MKRKEALDTNQLGIYGHGNVRTQLYQLGGEPVICQHRMYSDPRGARRARNLERSHITDALRGQNEAATYWFVLMTRLGRPETVILPVTSAERTTTDTSAAFEVCCGDCTALVFANPSQEGDVVYKCVLRSGPLGMLSNEYACVCHVRDIFRANLVLQHAREWIDQEESKSWPGQVYPVR
jgi:hypothetical protein